MKKIINVVGIGPGEREHITDEAIEAMKNSDIIIGYTVYVELIRKILPEKEYASTPMKKEIERCRLCFEEAEKGKVVSMICSGDAGVYGMAAPMLELSPEYEDIDINIIAGITAANSGAAVLGAPLGHDYCVISLSDLLTPWEIIEKRLKAAAMGDFAVAIYNPSSHKRKDYLKRACEIMLECGTDENTVCGYVENIGRAGTNSQICTLKELKDREVNMFTTVYIGSSNTRKINGKMVTPRGYRI